jgi:hypothetical protein
MVILNAFSLSMVAVPATIRVREVSTEEAARIAASSTSSFSAVGHEGTAAVFTGMLGIPVAFNRVSVKLPAGASALVGQHIGPRLPEGATVLPPGAGIVWLLVEVD